MRPTEGTPTMTASSAAVKVVLLDIGKDGSRPFPFAVRVAIRCWMAELA